MLKGNYLRINALSLVSLPDPDEMMQYFSLQHIKLPQKEPGAAVADHCTFTAHSFTVNI